MSVAFRALLLALAAAAPARADVTDRIARTVPVAADTPLIVEITVGDVSVSGWDRPEVAIEIARRAPTTEQLARIPAAIEERDGALVIRAVQAESGRDALLRTDVVLRVPAAVRIQELAVFEGKVELANVRGGVSAHAERGDIVTRGLSGSIRLETAIGNIRLDGAQLAPDGLIRLRTFNGDVGLELASPPENARILALSLGGTITSEIPLTRRERWGPRFGEATLGTGEPLISIDVVNGKITIAVVKPTR